MTKTNKDTLNECLYAIKNADGSYGEIKHLTGKISLGKPNKKKFIKHVKGDEYRLTLHGIVSVIKDIWERADYSPYVKVIGLTRAIPKLIKCKLEITINKKRAY